MQRLNPTPTPCLEVKDTLDQEKYIRHSAFWRMLKRQGAWASAALLSFGAAIPLGLKAILNVIDGVIFFDKGSLKAARNNLIGGILLSAGAGIFSTLSFIFPKKIGRKLIQDKILLRTHIQFKPKSNLDQDRPSDDATPPENPVYKLDRKDFTMYLPPKSFFPMVKGNGVMIDTIEIPCEDKDIPQYRICFNALPSYYQKHTATVAKSQKKIKAHTRLFNYPSVNTPGKIDSFEDLVNAGIAEVYDLAKRKQWTNAEMEANLHLYGFCSGGSVALEVAVYFKERHRLNLKLVIDRSYISFQLAAAYHTNQILGLPIWYAKLLFAAILYAGGEFHQDTIDAIKKLDRSRVQIINLGYAQDPAKIVSLMKDIRNFLGIGPPSKHSADPMIPDGATIADGLAEQKLTCGRTTRDIFTDLNPDQPHRFYSLAPNCNPHTNLLENLSVDRLASVTDRSAEDYYAKLVAEDVQHSAALVKR